ATEVVFSEGQIFIKNHDPNNLRKVQRLEDPAAPAQTLLRPLQAGVYRSLDNGVNWEYVGSGMPANQLDDVKKRLRDAQRLMLTASNTEVAAPVLFAGAIVQDKFQGLFRLDDDAAHPANATVRFVMDSPLSVERNHNTVQAVKATGSAGDWVALTNTAKLILVLGSQAKEVDLDFGALGAGATMANVAQQIQTDIATAFEF